MLFTIIIATCDRPERLAKCLDALAVAIKAHGEADRVIIVDNGAKERKPQIDADERGKERERKGVSLTEATAAFANCSLRRAREATEERGSSPRITLLCREEASIEGYAGQAQISTNGDRTAGGMMARGAGGESDANAGNRKPACGVTSERVCDSAVASDSGRSEGPSIMPSSVVSSSVVRTSHSVSSVSSVRDTSPASSLVDSSSPSANSAPLRETFLSPVKSVVEQFSARTGVAATYLRTEPRNKAKALNAGIAAADTEWLAFTDDDCLPDAQWLARAREFAAVSGARVFGGRIVVGEPDKPLPRALKPSRFGREHGSGIFVKYCPLPGSGMLQRGRSAPLGANVFVEKAVFGDHGGYDEALWKLCGRAALGSEDGEFGIRLAKVGEPIGYCHEAIVVHPLYSDRFSLVARMKCVYRFGWRDAIIDPDDHVPLFQWYLIRMLARQLSVAARDLLMGDLPGATSVFVGCAMPVGAFIGRLSRAYRIRRLHAAWPDLFMNSASS